MNALDWGRKISEVERFIFSFLLLSIYLTLTEVTFFTIKNIYIAVAIPLNDKDGMLIKVNEKINYKEVQNTMVKGVK